MIRDEVDKMVLGARSRGNLVDHDKDFRFYSVCYYSCRKITGRIHRNQMVVIVPDSEEEG